MKYGFFVVSSFLISILFFLIALRLLPYRWFPKSNPVLLISMDGFRHDYLEKVKAYGGKTPNFDYLINEGSRIMRMKNCFPTITLPNHHSLVTGLYPENHGIVLNTFVDKAFPYEIFYMNDQDNLNDPKWFEKWPEPIWVTLEKLGRLTASHLWPLADAPIRGKLPFFQESQYTLLDNPPVIFNHMKRVEDVVNWLTNPIVDIDFVMLYFEEPDEIGHSYGPNDPHVFNVIMKLDAVMGHMIALMKEKNIWNKVNIIITADHGMSEDSLERQIVLNNYVDPSFYNYTLLTPVGTLYPYKGKEFAVYNALKNKNPHLQVFWRHEVPASLNYNLDNGRIAPLILIAENRWSIVQKFNNGSSVYGNHGYNNSEPDVQPFFIAQGPDFRKNFSIPLGNSLDVYSLMCNLLGIKPNPNNGSMTHIMNILKPHRNSAVANWIRFLRNYILEALMILLSLILVTFVIAWVSMSKKRRANSGKGYSKIYNEIN